VHGTLALVAIFKARRRCELPAGEGRVFHDPHELARYLLSGDED
jgi:hypothetical protein